jgi:hypothetical protein
MLTWHARTPSAAMIATLVAARSDDWDTHPTLGERLERLGELERVPPPVATLAGEELLGAGLSALADQLDRQWHSSTGEFRAQARAEHIDRHARLERLAAIDAPTADQMFDHAELLESLERVDDALPIYSRAAALGHARASLAAGRVLLDRSDAAGVALVEAAMQRDEDLIPAGCEALAGYYRGARQELAARECEHRATKYVTAKRLSAGLNIRRGVS